MAITYIKRTTYIFDYDTVDGQHNQDAVYSDIDLDEKGIQALLQQRVDERNASIKRGLEQRIAEATAELDQTQTKLALVTSKLVAKEPIEEVLVK